MLPFSDITHESDTYNESETLQNSSTNSDASANLTEKQFTDLQNDILEQGRAIESFIRNHSAKKYVSETFRVLQTLFVLFKSALSMNINLRQIIIKNRYMKNQEDVYTRKSKNKISEFLKNVSKMTDQPIHSLQGVTQIIKTSANLKNQMENIEAENQKLTIQIRQLQNQIIDFEAQKEVDFARLHSRAESAETTSSDLKNQIRVIKENNLQLEQTISQIEHGKTEMIQQFQKQNIEEYQNISNKLKSAHKKIVQMRKEQELLQLTLTQTQAEKESFRISVSQLDKEKSQLLFEIEQLKHKNQEEICKKQEIIGSMTGLQGRLHSIEENQNEFTSKLEEEAKHIMSENKKLTKDNKKLIKALKATAKENQSLESENSQFIVAIDKLNTEIDEMKQYLDTTESDEDHEYQMRDIIQAFHDLRDGLGLRKQWEPKKISRHILNKIRKLESCLLEINESNEQQRSIKPHIKKQSRQTPKTEIILQTPKTNESPLQEQIRSLQDEIDSLRNELVD